MNKFDREHVDGIGDGLSIAMSILEASTTLGEAKTRIRDALLEARHAKDLDTMERLRAAASAPTVARAVR
jgi:hypothetical protein